MQRKLDTAVLREQATEANVPVKPEAGCDRDDGLLRTALPIMMVAYGIALAIVTFTFWQSGDSLLAIAICAVYVVMFFGVPIVMARIRNRHDTRWDGSAAEAAAERVAVYGGTIGRTEALLQMVIVPLAVVVAFAAFAVIWLSLKP